MRKSQPAPVIGGVSSRLRVSVRASALAVVLAIAADGFASEPEPEAIPDELADSVAIVEVPLPGSDFVGPPVPAQLPTPPPKAANKRPRIAKNIDLSAAR